MPRRARPALCKFQSQSWNDLHVSKVAIVRVWKVSRGFHGSPAIQDFSKFLWANSFRYDLTGMGPVTKKTRAILHFMFSYIFVSSVTLITCHFKMSMRWKVTCFIMCIVLWTCIVLVWWWVFGDRNILQLFTEYLWSLFGPNSFESSRLASFVSWLVVTPGSISSCDTSKCAETCWNGNWFYNDSNINCLWRQCKEWRSWGSRINAFHIFLWGCDTWVGWWPFTQVLLYHNHMIWIILVIFFAQTQTMSFRRRLCCY